MTDLQNRSQPTQGRARHVDVDALKRAHPIEDVATRYGVELRRTGRAVVGRCPLHADGGRPNFYAWPETSSWWCFRCNVGGDVIRLVELVDQVDFLEAARRLGAGLVAGPTSHDRPKSLHRAARPLPTSDDPDAQRVLHAAMSLYHRRLLTDPLALRYVVGRGVSRETIEQCRVGFAAGDEILPYLRWRSLGLGPALKAGLLDAAGREFLAGRIVVPDLQSGASGWMVGRLLQSTANVESDSDPPKYLGLPRPKPLFGAQAVRSSPSVIVTEGAFDYLVVRGWGYPVVALMGTHASATVVEQLRGYQRVYLALDDDNAGIEGTLRLVDALGPRAMPVALPEGVKDVAELGLHDDGQRLFAEALLESSGVLSDGEVQAA